MGKDQEKILWLRNLSATKWDLWTGKQKENKPLPGAEMPFYLNITGRLHSGIFTLHKCLCYILCLMISFSSGRLFPVLLQLLRILRESSESDNQILQAKLNIFVFVNQGSGRRGHLTRWWGEPRLRKQTKGGDRASLWSWHLPSVSLWGNKVSGRQSFILGAGITFTLLPSQGLDHGMNGLKLLSVHGSAVDIVCVAASVSLAGRIWLKVPNSWLWLFLFWPVRDSGHWVSQ